MTAARILARTRDPTRFPGESSLANYTGTAPVEIASADKQRHRLSRSGDRMLNSAIHIVGVPRHGHPAASAMPTTSGRWLRARPHGRRCAA
ncbi:transposase [Rhodococcus sp. BE178]|uniref:transposase n=1 Tax=Rhodococcus sp. BE178 TaxID=2817737 RepID=UPI003D20F7CB